MRAICALLPMEQTRNNKHQGFDSNSTDKKDIKGEMGRLIYNFSWLPESDKFKLMFTNIDS